MEFTPDQIEAVMQYPLVMIVLIFIVIVVRSQTATIMALIELIKKQSKKE